MSLRVEELTLYPVKSCGALPVDSFVIGEAGPQISIGDQFLGDRQWMFTDQDGKFLTQRNIQKLALIQPLKVADKFFLKIQDQKYLVPLNMQGAKWQTVTIWGKEVQASPIEGEISAAASEFLGKAVQFVGFNHQSRRESLLKGKSLGVQTRFTDSQQYLVVSQESLKDLNSRLERPIEANRFRPNILLSGVPAPYAEETWKSFGSDNFQMEATKACGRCKIITVDPETGMIPDSEPLLVLSKYRKKESSVLFGQYFLSRSVGQVLRVGENLSFVG